MDSGVRGCRGGCQDADRTGWRVFRIGCRLMPQGRDFAIHAAVGRIALAAYQYPAPIRRQVLATLSTHDPRARHWSLLALYEATMAWMAGLLFAEYRGERWENPD